MNPDGGSEARCVTCSDDLARVIVQAVTHEGMTAVACDVDGRLLEVVVELVGPVCPGEVLLVHAGVALGREAAGDNTCNPEAT